jgi:hypothetical protein
MLAAAGMEDGAREALHLREPSAAEQVAWRAGGNAGWMHAVHQAEHEAVAAAAQHL